MKVQPKIMLYSHDSWGLGHLRRTLAVAHALNHGLDGASVLIVSGSPCATQFPLDNGVDLVKLPIITKDSGGQYKARQLRCGLREIVALRSTLLESVFEAFAPDLLIVDHQLIGLSGELMSVLRRARRAGTYCIYGMRDVLDSPTATETAWANPHCQWALAEGYDEVWIYGDERQFDTVAAYPTLRTIRDRITYTGLIANGKRIPLEPWSGARHVLVTVGGGEDGDRLLWSYLHGIEQARPDWRSTIVTGPLLSEHVVTELRTAANGIPDTEVQRFHESIPSLLRVSDAVVSMAGYNSCAEIVSARCPAVLVPRTAPRREQLIRARYLEQCGAAACLVDPQGVELVQRIETSLRGETSDVSYPSTSGLDVVTARVRSLFGENRVFAETRASGEDRVAGDPIGKRAPTLTVAQPL